MKRGDRGARLPVLPVSLNDTRSILSQFNQETQTERVWNTPGGIVQYVNSPEIAF